MRWLQQLSLRLRAALWRTQVEREMEAELAEHLASETEDLIARGATPAEARRRARATVGHLDAIREECRDARGVAGWEHLAQDAAFAVRLLGKNRTFTCMALATMALAIGSTTAVFSLIDRILIRPLPFADPDRLFYASELGMRGPLDVMRGNSRLAEYAGYFGVRAFNTLGRDLPERVKGSEVTANFFQVLGVGPLLGRTFTAGEDRPGKLRVTVLSHDFWVSRYEARPDVIGQKLTLDESAYEIVGVMPQGFEYPAADARLWVPMRLDPRAVGQYWGTGGVSAFARLSPGAEPRAAAAEFRAWIPRIRAMFPWRMPDAWGMDAGLTQLRDYLVEGAKMRGLLLFGAATLVLLIAIVNVANLMMGQTAARRRELDLRISLGATPGRLTRQLMTEAAVLALAGGFLGTLLAFGQLSLLKRLLPADTPRLAEVAIDGRILAFTAVVSLGSGLLFGLLPAWHARSPRPLGNRSTPRTGAALVMTEACFATILLVGAGLLLRSLWTMLHLDPGFRVESVVTAELSPNRAVADSVEKTVALFEQVRTKLAGYPGVSHVAAMNVLPLTRETPVVTAAIEDHPRLPGEPQFPLWNTVVTAEHLDTLGIRLLQGRGFTAADRQGAPPVALVSSATARRFWPGISPIGKRFRPVWLKEWRTIVGVVADVRNFSMAGPPEWVEGEVYLPLAQTQSPPQAIALIARLAGRPRDFQQRLPQMIREVCPSCAVSKIAGMETIVSDAVEAPRSMAWLVGAFALLALSLAAAGIYGVVSHAVIRRTREMGVRLALGAGRGHLAWIVMASTLRSTLAGTLAGLAISWALARVTRTLLFGVVEHDAVSFSAAPVVLTLVAILAGVFPMYRATRVDPAQSLREG